ncbi:hypothetical protein EV363DRAFT_1169241, partial [Boletus edulis]
LGLQALGHTVDIYTSHHDPNHCFDETRDGNRPHRRPLDLHFTLFQQAPSPYTTSSRPSRAIGMANSISFSPSLTCTRTRRLLCRPTLDLYTPPPCAHRTTPSFLLSFPRQATRTWRVRRRRIAKAKPLYRYPMDYLEEVTTRQADTLVANSKFTARITRAHLSSITSTPKVVYPGINIEAYQAPIDWAAPDVDQINSDQPTLISLNRFEMKKNAALAIEAFALLRDKASTQHLTRNMRLVLAAQSSYRWLWPRLEDNIRTLNGLVERSRSSKLSFNVITPPQSKIPAPSFTGTTECDTDVLFLTLPPCNDPHSFDPRLHAHCCTRPRTSTLVSVLSRAWFVDCPFWGVIVAD